MNPVTGPIPGRPDWKGRVLLWAVLAVLVTLWSLQASFQYGRLALPANYDDVSYFNDGMDRLEQLQLGGWRALLHSLWSKPPHSPFSTGLACLSLGLFGAHDWAPYAGNAAIVFVLVGFIDSLLRGAPPWLRAAGLALVCALPLTERAVAEFRPDFAVALLHAIGTLLLVGRPLTGVPRRQAVLGGLAFGLALLVKPTASPFTAVLLGCSLVLAGLSDWWLTRPPVRRILGRVALVGLLAPAVAVPYYLRNHRHITSYVLGNVFGSNKALWAQEGSAWDHLGFYLWGPGAGFMLGEYGPFLAATLLAGAMGVLAGGRKVVLVRMLALAGATLVALAVPTGIPIKHGFYALTFYFLVLAGAVLSLRLLFAPPWPRPFLLRPAAAVLLAGLALKTLLADPRPLFYARRGDADTALLNRTCADVLAELEARRQEERPTVFVTMEWQANCQTLHWLARKEGRPLQFTGPELWGDLGRYRRAMEGASFILAYQIQTPYRKLPSEGLAPATLALARSLKGHAEVQSFRAPSGVVYYLFQRVGKCDRDGKSVSGCGGPGTRLQ